MRIRRNGVGAQKRLSEGGGGGGASGGTKAKMRGISDTDARTSYKPQERHGEQHVEESI